MSRQKECRAEMLWAVSKAASRVQRAVLIRQIDRSFPPGTAEATYQALLKDGEVREVRENRKVFVVITMRGLAPSWGGDIDLSDWD